LLTSSDAFITETDVRYQLGIRLRDYLSDICRCINLSHTTYKARSNERLLLQSGLILTLGEMRLLAAEVLFETVKIDLFSQGEALNMINDSTFHILAIWSLQKCHNNIYLVKYTDFFKLFCKRASPTSIINAFLKTNVVSDFANFFMDNIFRASTAYEQRDTFQLFLLEILTALKDIDTVIIY
jgi:hypothetical protein